MSCPLLLDQMLSDAIARQLRAKGHDVLSVVAGRALVSLPDDQILGHAAAAGRTLVTANIKDYMPLDAGYRPGGHDHAGLILISAKAFPRNRAFTAAVTSALLALLDGISQIPVGQVIFLSRS
jgi:hypothetical protein